MSQRSIGPREFNPVLGVSMAGVAVTASVLSSMVDAVQDSRFISDRLVPECIKIMRLSEHTRDLLVATAQTLEGAELERGRRSLIDVANEMHGRFVAHFDPEKFSASAREARASGQRPEHLMWRGCRDLVSGPLGFIDQVQAARMNGGERYREWKALEQRKQQIVDVWGKAGFDVSRRDGRERNYIVRSFLRDVGRWCSYAALGFGAFVLVMAVVLYPWGYLP